MNYRCGLWLASTLFLCLSFQQAAGQQDKSADELQKDAAEGAVNRITKLIGDGKVNVDLANEAIDVINERLKVWRSSQDAVYAFVRTVTRNIDSVKCSDSTCSEFKTTVLQTTRKLMQSSYTDPIGQNANLSNQVKTRLPLLIEDSLKLSGDGKGSARSYFQAELTIIADRWINSKRFRVGLGLTYTYLPSILFDGRARVDYSPFIPAPTGGLDTLIYQVDFTNKSFPGFLLSAKIPYVQIDASFPVYDTTQTTITPIQFRSLDGANSELLAQSTISSTLNVDFDVSAKVSVVEIVDRFTNGSSAGQFDYGLGVGVTGYELSNTIDTDVRFRSDGTSTFSELPSGEALKSANSISFNSIYLVGYYNFELTDEFQVGIEARLYDNASSRETNVEVDDVVIGISAIWFPTLAWLD